jgi:hypothetical protein
MPKLLGSQPPRTCRLMNLTWTLGLVPLPHRHRGGREPSGDRVETRQGLRYVLLGISSGNPAMYSTPPRPLRHPYLRGLDLASGDCRGHGSDWRRRARSSSWSRKDGRTSPRHCRHDRRPCSTQSAAVTYLTTTGLPDGDVRPGSRDAGFRGPSPERQQGGNGARGTGGGTGIDPGRRIPSGTRCDRRPLCRSPGE